MTSPVDRIRYGAVRIRGAMWVVTMTDSALLIARAGQFDGRRPVRSAAVQRGMITATAARGPDGRRCYQREEPAELSPVFG